MRSQIRPWAVAALLCVGILLCWQLYPGSRIWNPRLWDRGQFEVDNDFYAELLLVAIAVNVAFIPATRRIAGRALDPLRDPTPRARRWTALAIFLLSGPALYGLGAARGRLMLPMWHDENMYRLQTTFLAHGRLAMPGLPLPDFFESPYIFVRGVYAPVYFPGTAALHVPAALLHLPYWLTPLLIASVSLTLLYLVVSELIDGVWGLVAIAVMVSLVTFRWLALVEMSHAAGMMWGLVAMWAWLSWRRAPARRAGWAVLGGFAAGAYAITRPLDAICVLLPLAVAWTWDLFHRTRRAGAGGMREATLTVLLVLAAASPALALQLALNRAVTGRMTEMPLERYNRVYFNARSMGLQRFDPTFRPPTALPQIQKVYDSIDRPMMQAFTTSRDAADQWWHYRLPLLWGSTLPTALLLILLPVSIVGLGDGRRWVLWATAWTYLAGSAFFYLFLGWYTIAAAPAAVFALALGASTVERTWPLAGAMRVLLPLAVLAVGGRYIALNNQDIFEPTGTVSRTNYLTIPKVVRVPALVMCRFGEGERAYEEPVYNWDVVWPDDAPIIRAHDLGDARNVALFRYYADRQPARSVYLFNREANTVRPLGNVKDLAERGAASSTTAPSP